MNQPSFFNSIVLWPLLLQAGTMAGVIIWFTAWRARGGGGLIFRIASHPLARWSGFALITLTMIFAGALMTPFWFHLYRGGGNTPEAQLMVRMIFAFIYGVPYGLAVCWLGSPGNAVGRIKPWPWFVSLLAYFTLRMATWSTPAMLGFGQTIPVLAAFIPAPVAFAWLWSDPARHERLAWMTEPSGKLLAAIVGFVPLMQLAIVAAAPKTPTLDALMQQLGQLLPGQSLVQWCCVFSAVCCSCGGAWLVLPKAKDARFTIAGGIGLGILIGLANIFIAIGVACSGLWKM